MFKGKRIAAIDYGSKRLGFAVCDELHITVSPRECFYRDKVDFWKKLLDALEKDCIGGIVLGVPWRLDGELTPLIKEILNFSDELKEKSKMEVIHVDESYSTVDATQVMISIGKRKKKRSIKENKDKIAAAIILRQFLDEND
jgi:putative holliday junction resolvase